MIKKSKNSKSEKKSLLKEKTSFNKELNNTISVTKKNNQNIKHRIGWIILAIVLIIPLVLLIIINKNNYNTNTSYITKYNITLSKASNSFMAPIYSFAVDKDNNPIEIKNLKFLNNNITYSFTNIKREILDDDNELISVSCNMEANIEFVELDDINEEWYYTFSFSPAFSFDYYTGDIYLENTISNDKTIIMREGKSNNDKNEEMAITDLTFKNKKISIGRLNKELQDKWSSTIYDGKNDDGRHYKSVNKSTFIMKFKMPRNYDGILIAINKNGSNYDTWKKSYDYYRKIVSLQNDYEKTGKKSIELDNLEKENKNVYKLFDDKNEKGKDFTKDDYYVFRLIDLISDDYLISSENNVNILYIFGIIVLSISIITCILMFLRKDY